MKINISRQSIYLLVLSLILLIFVLLFAFLVLIPYGKEYRVQKQDLKKEYMELYRYQNFNDEISDKLKGLQSANRHIITAFDTAFDAERFEKQYKTYFSTMQLTQKQKVGMEDEIFHVYEVNTTSHISSPTTFYDFLDAVNKSDWIIGVNFPIHFKRDAEMISSSFTMQVYSAKAQDDSNTTK